ncbi:MAG: DNA polymerase III subunit delta [Candidatus Moranbacteria bacterium]|nr:DNA polymerase III subunit delta [Candidatus Moranbacteria bacterium]
MIIFLYGEDAFRSREKLTQLRSAYLEKNPSSGLFEFDGDSSSEDVVKIMKQTLNESGLFATKKLVIARRFTEGSESIQKKLIDFLEEKIASIDADKDNILIFWEAKMPKKTNVLYKLLDKQVAKKQRFETLKGVRLEQWIVHRIHMIDAGTNIENRALPLLISEMGDDLLALENELRKLTDFCEDKRISEKDVALFVAQSVRSLVFEALEALASGNRAKALRLFEEQLEKGENALYLLSMCAWQMRNLLKVADGYADGCRQAPLLAKETKLHPFVVQKLLRQIGHFPLERIRQDFSLLANLDTQAKTGALDPKLALDMFVMKA